MRKNIEEIQGQAANLNALIDTSCTKYADHNAIGMALKPPITYQEFHNRIFVLAAHLRKNGVQFGDRVALLAENSHNWGTVYFAVIRLGAVCVPILPDLPEDDVHHILTEMECDVVFSSKRQIGKLEKLNQKISLLITLDDYQESVEAEQTDLLPFTEFLSKAKAEHAEDLKKGSLRFPEVDSDHPASILYTSGTSGFSKAVILSHGNLCANAAAAGGALALEPGAVFLSVLPLAHTYKFTVGLLMPLLKGGCGQNPDPGGAEKTLSS